MDKFTELQEELKLVFSGKWLRFLGSFLPLVVFLISNQLIGINAALLSALGIALIVALLQIMNKESVVYSLGGGGGVLLAAILVKLSGTESGFFLPGLISGGITVVLCIITVAINRPLVAWTSHFVRQWPRNWYWHPQVLPAYNEVTITWAAAFAIRLALEFWLLQNAAANTLGIIRLILGWPFTIALLIGTYLYGLWRLDKLNGPSVDEFTAGKPAPWEGQRRGF